MNPNNGKAFGHIPHCAYKTIHTHTHTHTHTNTHTRTHICTWMVLMKATNYEALCYVLYTTYLLPSLSHTQIIFLPTTFTKSDSRIISLKFWSWTIHILRQMVDGWISWQSNARNFVLYIHALRKYFHLRSKIISSQR